MNERIRELAEQAKNFMTDQVLYQSRVHNRTLSIDEGADIFEEKFAELIVEECADIVKYYHSRNETVTPRQILQHFGVE